MNYFTIINIYDILLLYDNISIRQELDYNAIRLMLFVYSKKTKNIYIIILREEANDRTNIHAHYKQHNALEVDGSHCFIDSD